MSKVRAFVEGHWQLLLLGLVVVLFWDTDPVYPLRMLVILFHEISHGIAAVLTGGEIVALELSRNEGGVIWTRGGNRFLISSAGYLGSLLIGVALFVFAVRTRADRWVLGLCGGVILLVTLWYVRDLFSILFCSIAGVGMVSLALLTRAEVSDFVLRLIGLTSMAYVPWDIWDDTIRDRPMPPGAMSDAAAIAARSFGTETMWGLIWLTIGIAVIAVTLIKGMRGASNIPLGPPPG